MYIYIFHFSVMRHIYIYVCLLRFDSLYSLTTTGHRLCKKVSLDTILISIILIYLNIYIYTYLCNIFRCAFLTY